MRRLEELKEFLVFLKKEKKWWLFPILVILTGVALLLWITQGAALTPFIYTLF